MVARVPQVYTYVENCLYIHCCTTLALGNALNYSVHDFGLPPLSRWELRSSVLLRSE